MDFKFVYRDSSLIVLEKPSGLLCQPGLGPDLQDCLLRRVQLEYPTAQMVHRLDRDTSGLIVMALDIVTVRQLNRQFHDRQVEKIYAATVLGAVADDSGRIEAPLRKDFDRPPRHKVDFVAGRQALTCYQVLRRSADRTHLELRPHTGRSHQLRVHLHHLGHPILGDKLYACPTALAMADRLQLHATLLALVHPQSGLSMVWESACPF